jgi:hypothetical protein
MFRPPGLLATEVVPTTWHGSHTKGSRDVCVHAYLGSLPLRPVDMLAVRIEQLTAAGLSPSKIRGLAGRSYEIQPRDDAVPHKALAGSRCLLTLALGRARDLSRPNPVGPVETLGRTDRLRPAVPTAPNPGKPCLPAPPRGPPDWDKSPEVLPDWDASVQF